VFLSAKSVCAIPEKEVHMPSFCNYGSLISEFRQL